MDDQLLPWLRAQIAAAEASAHAKDELDRPHGPGCGITADVSPVCDCDYWKTVLGICEAHILLLNGYVALRDHPARATDTGLNLQWIALGEVITTIGWGYRHLPGYRMEWKP